MLLTLHGVLHPEELRESRRRLALARALLAATQGLSMAEATGAFLVCAVLIIVAGATRAFERGMDRPPMAVAAALLHDRIDEWMPSYLSTYAGKPLPRQALDAYPSKGIPGPW